MKIKELSILLTALVFSVSFGYARESSEPAIAMSFKPNGKITFYIAGITAAGPVVIDWGDGSPEHTQQLSPFNQKYDEKVHAVSHTYSTNSVCTISITGKGITSINCNGLGLTSLILNVPLMWVECNNNQLTSLDVSKSGLLTLLDCSRNQLTSLDVSQNIYLGILNCSNNQLTTEALDALFASLNSTPNKTPTAGNPVIPKQITIDGNPGTDACHKNIAADKSWIVRGTKQEAELLNSRQTTVSTEPTKLEGIYRNKTGFVARLFGKVKVELEFRGNVYRFSSTLVRHEGIFLLGAETITLKNETFGKNRSPLVYTEVLRYKYNDGVLEITEKSGGKRSGLPKQIINKYYRQ